MEKVSIIVPVYNTEKYLDKCIKSVLTQTHEDIELIIINDGSPGNCDEIVNSFSDKRIKYFKNKNQGIGKTRNFGIDNANGDFIVFLDSDDYLENNAIELLLSKAKNDKLDIVICDYFEEFENTNNKSLVKLITFDDTTLQSNPSLINNINLGPSNKLFSKKLFNNLRFPENIKYEDFALVLKLFDKANKIGKVDKPLFIFNRLNNGQTQTVDEKVYDLFISLDEVVDYFNGKYPKEIDMLLCKMCTLYAAKQKYQVNKEIKNSFVNDCYTYLNSHVDNYKCNDYFKTLNILKRFIFKHKIILKIYINL